MDDKKALNLEDVMYNYDGTFIPFVGHHGNISVDIENYRNTYMEAERDYFSQLLVDEKLRNYLLFLLERKSYEDIFEEAMRIQELLETGKLESEKEKIQMQSMTPEERDRYHLHKLMYAEGMMCLLFAAIRDKALVLDEVQSWNDRISRMNG